MSKGLLISRRQKYALSKKCIVEPSQINTNNFKSYRNVYNKAIRCAKKLYFEKQLQINKSNLKKTWKILKEAVNSKVQKSSGVDCILVNGVELSDPTLIAEALNNFFISAASDIVDDIPHADPPVQQPTNDDIPLNQHEIVVIVDLLLIKPELHIEVRESLYERCHCQPGSLQTTETSTKR